MDMPRFWSPNSLRYDGSNLKTPLQVSGQSPTFLPPRGESIVVIGGATLSCLETNMTLLERLWRDSQVSDSYVLLTVPLYLCLLFTAFGCAKRSRSQLYEA